MKVAIYSRKSKFTGKGESVENQIQLCKEYIEKHFSDRNPEMLIYEDEGYSGGTVDRPMFQAMLKDAKAREFSILICYRLDRVSRNIADFSTLIEELQDYGISFISIREQFDTSTPMGRAMMYIASVFAQLERETIAERIRDNMLQLAKTGRWLGGVTPTGYDSKPSTYTDSHGKDRKMHMLVPIEEELDVVKLIYAKFLELRSLTKLESYCVQNNIKTKNNIDYSRFALRNILTNPVYATADKTLYNWLMDNDIEVYASESDFDGISGVMAYNKTIQHRNTTIKRRDVSEWILSVGAHPGVITGKKWLTVQKLISRNKSKAFRKVKNSESLLSGILRCANCGSFMRPRSGRIDQEGVLLYYYMCELKEKSKKSRCQNKNAQGNKLDKLLVEEIKSLASSTSGLGEQITSEQVKVDALQNSLVSEIEVLETNIKNNDQSISNLVNNLSQGQNTNACKYIIDQINALDKQNSELKNRLLELKEKRDVNVNQDNNLGAMRNLLEHFATVVDELDVPQKRELIRSIVDQLTWDGKRLNLVLFGDTSKKDPPSIEV
ncbi:MAG: recombinase family protein [Firmicutes bacterium]|nr:recombinase family protein [Bacillota bacterium]